MCHKRGTPKICDDLTVRSSDLFMLLQKRSCIYLARCQVKLETLVIQFVVTCANEVHENTSFV